MNRRRVRWGQGKEQENQVFVDTDEQRDPYLNEQPPRAPMRCPVCGNIYANKQWYLPAQIDLDAEDEAGTYTCPGCQKVQDGYFYGELVVQGSYLRDHHREISNLIQNEVQRSQKKNPLSKLVSVDAEEGRVRFRTTNGKLAEHLGRSLENAHGGTLRQSKEDNITRVAWERSSST